MNYPTLDYPFCFICNSIVQSRTHLRMEDYCKKCNVSYVFYNYKNLEDFIAFYKDKVNFVLKDNNWIYEGEAYHPAVLNISQYNSWIDIFKALDKIRTFG